MYEIIWARGHFAPFDTAYRNDNGRKVPHVNRREQSGVYCIGWLSGVCLGFDSIRIYDLFVGMASAIERICSRLLP
jgi:hypothetical protein